MTQTNPVPQNDENPTEELVRLIMLYRSCDQMLSDYSSAMNFAEFSEKLIANQKVVAMKIVNESVKLFSRLD